MNVGENVKSILCCVCSKCVLGNDTVVRCSLDDKPCEAVAHASCAGYTTRGASRAKFICADHRASKLLQGSKSKLKSQGLLACLSTSTFRMTTLIAGNFPIVKLKRVNYFRVQ